MKIHKMPQQSPEWFAIRKGKMSASHAQAIGNTGKGLDTYINQLMAEFYSAGEKEHYTNADIERGIELEETAREIYEFDQDVEVEQVGFIEMNEFVGCSPDGLVGEVGGIEIKALNDPNHFALLIHGPKMIESKYIWQIQMSLLITGREWWDYVSYNPNFKESLFIERIKPDKVKQEKIKNGIEKGTQMIKEIKSLIK